MTRYLGRNISEIITSSPTAFYDRLRAKDYSGRVEVEREREIFLSAQIKL